MEKFQNPKRIFFEKHFIYFLLYSIIGWIYEEYLELFVFKTGFSNRGVLVGPYLPVYGVGTLAFIFILYPLIKNKDFKRKIIMIPLIFILCMFIATSIELVTSYICEFFMGDWPWTYLEYPYNFEGRIALSASIRFGLGGVAFLYILQPLYEKMLKKIGDKKVDLISKILIPIFLVDMIYSFFIK